MNILAEIQKELKAPKNQRNSLGGYNYRSCEDILEAVKPILHKHELAIIIKDEIVAVLDRVYVKATASLYNADKSLVGESVAYAREPVSKKGQDDSQITGATSSYARKYALNGLFAIDDTKDADTMDNRNLPEKKPVQQPEADDTDKDSHYDDYKQEILAAKTIDKVNALAADARAHCNELGWTTAQKNEFATIIKNKIASLKGEIG